MKYQKGDKVLVKSLDWYKENKDENGSVLCNYNYYFTRLMTKYCGEVMTIKDIINIPLCRCYMFEEDEFMCHFTDDMIEGLVEEEVDLIPKFGEYSDNEPLDIPTMTTEFVKEHGLPCPNGYIFKDENGNEILTSKIILEKKNEYPKTYEECCVALEYIPHTDDIIGYKWDILQSLQELLICRDAYWKIAGEEMGLGKPWEPNYKKERYVISRWIDEIVKGYRQAGLIEHFIFEFPTEEMLDAFYEAFKKLIEECKELL